MLKNKEKKTRSNPFKLLMLKHKYHVLENRYNKYVKTTVVKDKRIVFNKHQKEIEYNRSLLMPYYRDDVVTNLAKKKTTPKIINNLVIKKHRYGEVKEQNYKLALAKVEIMQDVCRINNWTTKKDWEKHKVPVANLFKELYVAATEYSDILKYYAKLRFDQRKYESS